MGKAKKDKKLIKFGGGFYCASLPCGEDQIYAFNGFFMSMRSKFVGLRLGGLSRQSVGSHGYSSGLCALVLRPGLPRPQALLERSMRSPRQAFMRASPMRGFIMTELP